MVNVKLTMENTGHYYTLVLGGLGQIYFTSYEEILELPAYEQ